MVIVKVSTVLAAILFISSVSAKAMQFADRPGLISEMVGVELRLDLGTAALDHGDVAVELRHRRPEPRHVAREALLSGARPVGAGAQVVLALRAGQRRHGKRERRPRPR